MPLRKCLPLVAAACCLLAAGCGSPAVVEKSTESGGKPVHARFSNLDTGMTEAQVIDLMGPPTDSWEVSPNQRAAVLKQYQLSEEDAAGAPPKLSEKRWEDGGQVFAVVFRDGQMIGKVSWSPNAFRPAANANAVTAGSSTGDTAPGIGASSAKAGTAAIAQTPCD